jgi:hypothetical protein
MNFLTTGTRRIGLAACRTLITSQKFSVPAGLRSFSIDGAESEEDAHEILFYSLRKPATITLKEMYAFGASSKHSTRTLLLAAQVCTIHFHDCFSTNTTFL